MTRRSSSDALKLITETDLHTLGQLAHAETLCRHTDGVVTYVIDRNINYTNICSANCLFCNFRRDAGDSNAYVLTFDQLLAKVAHLATLDGHQILIQGGLNHDLPWRWIVDMLKTLKSHYPNLHIHGFSPPEIVHFAKIHQKTIQQVIGELKNAGLNTIPGGGAEILVDRVRKIISPGKCTTDQWLDVMACAHRIGMRTTATMMFGHIETAEDRIEHLQRIRDLQDQTGGFTAFILWPFQSQHTALATDTPPGVTLNLASVQDYLRTVAAARLFLDNIDNIQASWVTQGPQVAQIALHFGANDFGSLMIEENVVASAGAAYRLTESELRQHIVASGFTPCRRNCTYQRLPIA